MSGERSNANEGHENDVIDLGEIDRDVPLTKVQGARHVRHTGQRMSKEHIAQIKRRHRRERFLVKLDLTLFIIVCLGGAAVAMGLQALQ